MKKKRLHRTDAEALMKLRCEEAQLAGSPSTDSYVKLADAYRLLGMGKEADRLLQMAEAIENGQRPQPPPPAKAVDGLLSGKATPTMVIEVIQILSRTKLSGDFIIDAQTETFHLFFDDGFIVSASSCRHAAGVDSFRMALKVSQGTYHFVQKPLLKDVPHLIHERVDVLLLHAMQDQDERMVKGNHP